MGPFLSDYSLHHKQRYGKYKVQHEMMRMLLLWQLFIN